MTTTKAKFNLRAGSYGDPANVPFEIFDELYRFGLIDGTGYTHDWRTCDQRYQKYLMASVDSESEAHEARAIGWRTYGVLAKGGKPDAGAIMCPESTNPNVTCDTCLLCSGNRKQAKNITIPVIGKATKATTCYVNTGWLTAMYESWKAGRVPQVAPATIGKFLADGQGKVNGTVEAWRGISPQDGAPIVLLVTGLVRPSQNSKTGPMVQTYILRRDMRPIEAVTSGADAAICGSCPFRPSVARAQPISLAVAA